MWLRRFMEDRNGAAAVELSIIATVLFTFIFGIFNVGWALYRGNDVRHGIERGARIYILKPTATNDEVRAAIAAELVTVPINDVTITITKPTVSGVEVAQIAWTYNYTVTIPFAPAVTFNLGSQILAPLRKT